MVLPVLAGAERLAVVALTDRTDGRPFDARDFQAARMFAATAAPAFTRERLRERLDELTQLATVDPLTGLFNRRYFETRLEAEAERARRQAQDLALLLIDIDNFKHVNDMRGHLEGDRTLRDVADLLRAGVRIFDVCTRYGGEEFVIVMPDAPVAVASRSQSGSACVSSAGSLTIRRLSPSALVSACWGATPRRTTSSRRRIARSSLRKRPARISSGQEQNPSAGPRPFAEAGSELRSKPFTCKV